MKPKNFPARRLLRQLIASRNRENSSEPFTDEELGALSAAKAVRTKKDRIGMGRL